jgi:serine/threonine protein kinase, bacterial
MVPPVWRWTPPATSTSPTKTTIGVLKLPAGSSSQIVLPFIGLHAPWGAAVVAAGNLYIVDYSNHRVLTLAAGSSTQTVLPFTGLETPQGMAVDPAGNLYVVDIANRLVKLPAG